MSSIPGLGGSAARFLGRLPASQTILIRRRRFPFQIPPSDALLAMEPLARAHQFIAHASSEAAGLRLDSGDLEFGGLDCREGAERGTQLLE